MKPNQKLELTWIGKGEEPKLEPRILILASSSSDESPSFSAIEILFISPYENLIFLKIAEPPFPLNAVTWILKKSIPAQVITSTFLFSYEMTLQDYENFLGACRVLMAQKIKRFYQNL